MLMCQKHSAHNLGNCIHTFHNLIGFMTLSNDWQHQQGRLLKDQANCKAHHRKTWVPKKNNKPKGKNIGKILNYCMSILPYTVDAHIL